MIQRRQTKRRKYLKAAIAALMRDRARVPIGTKEHVFYTEAITYFERALTASTEPLQ